MDGMTTQYLNGRVSSPSQERAAASRMSNMALRAWTTGFFGLWTRPP